MPFSKDRNAGNPKRGKNYVHLLGSFAIVVRPLARKNQGALSMKKFWSEHRADFILAVALFIASLCFFSFFATMSAGEYGASDISFAASCRWDCGWYSSIVKDGYHLEPIGHPKGDAANWAFFPAFPLAAKLIALLSGSQPGIALVITSKLFFFGCIFIFLIAAKKEFGSDARLVAGMLVAFNPYVVYAHVGYTEPLYFFLTTLAFLAVGSQRWVMAGLASAMLSATRIVGIIFTFVLLVAYLRTGVLANRRLWPMLALALLLCPLGLAGYMAYLHAHVGDALAFMHVQVAWGREIQNPVNVVLAGLHRGGWSRYFVLCALAGLGMGCWLIMRKRYGHALFLIGTVLIPLTSGVDSMPRYVFWQFPFLFGLLELLLAKRILMQIYLVFTSAMSGFVILSWFIDKRFVI